MILITGWATDAVVIRSDHPLLWCSDSLESDLTAQSNLSLSSTVTVCFVPSVCTYRVALHCVLGSLLPCVTVLSCPQRASLHAHAGVLLHSTCVCTLYPGVKVLISKPGFPGTLLPVTT